MKDSPGFRAGLLCAALLAASAACAQTLPEVSVGRIERLPALASRHVDPRPVDVWLPADYSPTRRYHVLYMHDGQMLFDAARSWNRQAWDVHLAVDRLVRAILLAGAYELAHRPDVPLRVVINEYVEIAHAFYDKGEPSFINSVLDRVARQARPSDQK